MDAYLLNTLINPCSSDFDVTTKWGQLDTSLRDRKASVAFLKEGRSLPYSSLL